MANFIPTASEQNFGISEVLYHAQRIVDAYGRALADNNCMTQVPIRVHDEAQTGINEMEDILSAIGGGSTSSDDRTPEVKKAASNVIAGRPAPHVPLNRATVAIRKALGEECFDCGWDKFPEFTLGSIWEMTMAKWDAFISKCENLISGLGSLTPGICHLAYLLSFVCIPDLTKIIAVLTALLIKILTAFKLTGISLSMFVMAIIGAIIGALFEYLSTVMTWALAPIGCFMDTITEIMSAIPTRDNVNRIIPSPSYAEEKIGYQEPAVARGAAYEAADSVERARARSARKTMDEWYKGVRETGDLSEGLHSTFGMMRDWTGKGVQSIRDTWDDLLGLATYSSCEGTRSGLEIEVSLGSVVELVEVINLITAIIRLKSGRQAIAQLCNNPDVRISSDLRTMLDRQGTAFTIDDIATVIESAYGGTAYVLDNSKADDDLAILFTPGDNSPSNRLSLFSCSLNEFISDMNMDRVVEESVVIAEDVLIGSGKNPFANRERISADDLPENTRSQTLFFDQADGFSNEVMRIIEEVVAFNRPEQDEDTELYSLTIPDQVENTESAGRQAVGHRETQGERSPDPMISRNRNRAQISAMPSGVVNRSVHLKCGTISDLQKSLSFLDENK